MDRVTFQTCDLPYRLQHRFQGDTRSSWVRSVYGAPVDGLREMHGTIRTNGRYKSVPSLGPAREKMRNKREKEEGGGIREKRREKLLGGIEISSYTFSPSNVIIREALLSISLAIRHQALLSVTL
ncbi:hypothetical protein PUN28_000733 [Cardiocondyla obscurior]|uniref:Uncharacterized protein n=1 Tax=Cardiocondyla obscurior TaxID=286306 RepID=A0AAW2H0S4_9HYME